MLFKILSVLIGIIVVLVVMSFFGIADIIKQLLSADVSLILLALVLQFAVIGIMAVRLRTIAGNCSIFATTCHLCTYWTALKTTFIGIAVNSLTPFAKVGGEPAKIYYLKEKGFSTDEATAVIATDTLIELISTYVIVLVSVFVMSISGILPPSTMTMLVNGLLFSLFVFGFVFFLILNRSMLRKTIRFISTISRTLGAKKFAEKCRKKDYAHMFQDTMAKIFQRKKEVLEYFILSFVEKIFEFVRTWIIFLALGVILPMEIVIFVWSILMIISLLPWLPGNLGLVEVGGTSAYILFGMTAAVGASGMIIERLMTLWMPLAVGLFVVWTSHIDKIHRIVRSDKHRFHRKKIIVSISR